jgi:hypothetical protein
MRILVRREKIEVGAQLSLFEQLNGFRYVCHERGTEVSM